MTHFVLSVMHQLFIICVCNDREREREKERKKDGENDKAMPEPGLINYTKRGERERERDETKQCVRAYVKARLDFN